MPAPPPTPEDDALEDDALEDDALEDDALEEEDAPPAPPEPDDALEDADVDPEPAPVGKHAGGGWLAESGGSSCTGKQTS